MTVWMDLLLVSAALLPWVMQCKTKRCVQTALKPVAVKSQAEPAGQAHQAQEY